MMQRHLSTSTQLPVRIILLLVTVMVLVAAQLGLDNLLGAFAAGMIARLALSKEQSEALAPRLEAIGFGFLQSVRYILLPQLVRIIAPSIVNESVSLIKNTSLALAIGVADITYQARYIDYSSFRGVEALAATTVFYLVICTTIAGLGHVLQRRLSRHRRSAA